MTPRRRLAGIIFALALVATACGGDGATEATTTTAAVSTSVATTTTTTAAPTTTTAATTTTTSTSTTTTSAPTTTTTSVSSEEADARVAAKTAAAAEAVPDGWDTAIVTNQFSDEAEDVIFGACSEADGFDLAYLDAATIALAELDATGPQDPTLPAPPQANVEARVFESETVAADAFAVLEQVLGSDAGRQCVADSLTGDLSAELPPDTEFTFELDALEAAGADVGARIVISLSIQGITAGFTIDLLAHRDGDCTVYAAFFGFGAEFEPALRDAIVGAALSA